MKPFANDNLLFTWIFMHDNDPNPASKVLYPT